MGRTTAALARLLLAQGQHIEDRVRDTHIAVSDRVFDAIGPIAAPVRTIHDQLGHTVHGAVRQGIGVVGQLAARVASQVDDELVADTAAGRATIGVVLGLVGSSIRETEPDLDWPTTLLDIDGTVLAAFGGARATPLRTPEVVVLLHGLCETEQAWRWGTGLTRPSIPDRLAAPDRTIVLARVNSGRRPAEVGAELAHVLAAIDSDAVQRVVLVGHSMGGLLARAAVRSAVADGFGWVERCDTLITVGTPHLGAPLEQAVEVLVRAGAMAREVDAITSWFEQRADGVRDLRHGTITDDVAPGQPAPTVSLPAHVAMHTVGSTLRQPVLAALAGDGLVKHDSAHAVGRPDIALRRGPSLHLTGRSHFDLLADPQVGAHLAAIVDAAPTTPS
jgi:pimeloyl-ACP methyl ester carboxylesterase